MDVLEAEKARADGHDVLLLPCGKCLGCRTDRGQLWQMRIMHEAAQYERNGFLTLTYDDYSLPHGRIPSLDPRDLQCFWKRVRKAGITLRYFAVGEYGGKTNRPHYHAITFGWLPQTTGQVTASAWQSDQLDRLWGLGNCTVGEVTPASAAYVAQYCLKKLTKEAAHSQGRHPEFQTQSVGIGRGWLDKYASDLDRGYVVFQGRKVRIPRYYLEKKGDEDPEWYLLMRLAARERRRNADPFETTPERLSARAQIHQAKKGLKHYPREPDSVNL